MLSLCADQPCITYDVCTQVPSPSNVGTIHETERCCTARGHCTGRCHALRDIMILHAPTITSATESVEMETFQEVDRGDKRGDKQSLFTVYTECIHFFLVFPPAKSL